MAFGKFIIAAGGAFGCNGRGKPSPLMTNSSPNGTVFLTLAMRTSTERISTDGCEGAICKKKRELLRREYPATPADSAQITSE